MTIEQICKKYNITNYTINSDGSIDVDGNVDLYDNGLTELPLTFNRVSGHFVCSWNCLTTLKGSPKWVGDRFSCNDNQLTSLEFGPEYVNKGFNCSYNDLTDLIGSPKKIGGYFMVEDNKLLKNPKGCTEKIGGLFHCRNTPFGSIFNVVDQNFLHAFNFYKIIKDDTVNLKRLKYVMDLYDLPIDLDKIEKYYRLV
jgi:hypothetical protein